MEVSVVLHKKPNVYHPGDEVSGSVVIDSKSGGNFHSIKLVVDGTASLQLSARSIGLFEAFYSSLKPVELLHQEIDVSGPRKANKGTTEFPFSFFLQPNHPDQELFDTYHGVYVNIQYSLTVDVKRRSAFSKNLHCVKEFIVEKNAGHQAPDPEPYEFTISVDSLENVKENSKRKIPDFLFEGKLDSVICDINKPFTGELIIRKCAVDIKSIELQLVRVETCAYMEGKAREATEIQNIQLAEGNVLRGLGLPIHMIFPRLFTCTTVKTGPFEVEFEVNLIILFADNHMVTENFTIELFRGDTGR